MFIVLSALLKHHRTFPKRTFSTNSNNTPITGPGAKEGTIPSDFEQSVGVERLELLSQLAGKQIFSSAEPLAHPRGPEVKGSLGEPVLVESIEAVGPEGRIVGCSGQPRGSHEIGFFWVRSAKEATRCPECGQAFKLKLI